MRSRSSLLSHLLGSHPQIAGYSELHCSYKNVKALANMKAKINLKLKNETQAKYYLDKILHNYPFSADILNNSNIKIIFLLREPQATIQSIIQLGHITGATRWLNKPFKALDYYCARLLKLEEFFHQLQVLNKNNYFFIESDDLVKNPNNLLSNLQSWLNLDSPINEQYSIFSDTGKAGYGDPSENIKTGKIIKNKKDNDIILPDKVIDIGKTAYDKCFQKLIMDIT